jgi:DNA-binding response OmpR family regulator
MQPAVTSLPILFVDDSAVARLAVKRSFASRGLAVVIFASFAEASAARGEELAAALLDIELGDGFGTDLAVRLREGAPHLPIAFLTAGGPPEILAEAARLGPVFSKASEVEEAVRWVAEASGHA